MIHVLNWETLVKTYGRGASPFWLSAATHILNLSDKNWRLMASYFQHCIGWESCELYLSLVLVVSCMILEFDLLEYSTCESFSFNSVNWSLWGHIMCRRWWCMSWLCTSILTVQKPATIWGSFTRTVTILTKLLNVTRSVFLFETTPTSPVCVDYHLELHITTTSFYIEYMSFYQVSYCLFLDVHTMCCCLSYPSKNWYSQ